MFHQFIFAHWRKRVSNSAKALALETWRWRLGAGDLALETWR